jgi:SAM-dependent methyltransferase
MGRGRLPGRLERLETALWRRLPPQLRRPIRRLLYLPVDAADVALRRRPAMVPPRGLQYHGAGDFRATGHHLVDLLAAHAGLAPSSRVLDIGCGLGRAAVALTEILDGEGSYDGFDVSRSDVAWCRQEVSARFPRFRFHLADIGNSEYNTAGREPADAYRFPFPDSSFDVALAASVLTHLLSGAVRRYLAESARVLRPGGRLLATFFLLDEATRSRLAASASPLRFADRCADAWVHEPRRPEAIVAYDLGWVRDSVAHAGLEIVEPIRFGTWSGRDEGASYQDVVVARVPRS